MNVYLSENSNQLPGDMILKWVLRSDLTPVPRTVELTVKMIDGIEDKLAVGKTFYTGFENLKYRVLKAQRDDPAGVVQGNTSLQAMTVTAFLDSCAEVGYRQPRSVVKQNSSLGEIFRACGANASISNDFNVRRFACMKGAVPSFQLAISLQEECAALVLKNKQIGVVRLPDLFTQTPKTTLGQSDSSAEVNSEFLQRHEIPAYFSTDDDGNFVMGDFSSDRVVEFRPRTDERTLRNLSRVLVLRKVVPSSMCQEIQAGDLMEVGGQKLVVMTAVHAFELRDGATDTKSRIWLGAMSS